MISTMRVMNRNKIKSNLEIVIVYSILIQLKYKFFVRKKKLKN